MLTSALTLVVGCSAPASTGAQSRPPGLIVLPGADNVRGGSDNEGVLQYDLKATFPAEQTIAGLTDALAREGWSEVTERRRYSGLGHPAPHELGWQTTLDNEARVLTWTAAWRNGSGSVVEYNLTYRTTDLDPLKNPEVNTLHVFAYRIREEQWKRTR